MKEQMGRSNEEIDGEIARRNKVRPRVRLIFSILLGIICQLQFNWSILFISTFIFASIDGIILFLRFLKTARLKMSILMAGPIVLPEDRSAIKSEAFGQGSLLSFYTFCITFVKTSAFAAAAKLITGLIT
jgi:hypothetical protein